MFWNNTKSSKFDNSSEMKTSMSILSDLSKMKYNSFCSLGVDPQRFSTDIEGHITIYGAAESCRKLIYEYKAEIDSLLSKPGMSFGEKRTALEGAGESIEEETNKKIAKLLLGNNNPESYLFSNLRQIFKLTSGNDITIDYPIAVLEVDESNKRSSFLKALLKKCSDTFPNCSISSSGDHATIYFSSQS